MKTVSKLWFENERIYIETTQGEVLSQPMIFFPRLQQATSKDLLNWTESHFGIHWETIDEDISFESFYWDDNDPLTVTYCDYNMNKIKPTI
jgi:hypothetical protein